MERYQPREQDRWEGESDEQLMDRKRRSAEKNGLADHIRQNGVQNPVHLGTVPSGSKPEIYSGHHRIAVMLQHNPDQPIPVQHHDSWQSSLDEQVRTDEGPPGLANYRGRGRIRGLFRRSR